MIAALVAGRFEDGRFPGRNTVPVLGRPLMVYPLMAALNAQRVDRVFLTTDAEPIARIARHLRVEVLERPPELTGQSVTLEDILEHGHDHMVSTLGLEVEALVVLLCNAPTVTSGMIDRGIEILLKHEDLDAVMSVSQHNEFHPHYSLRLAKTGALEQFLQPPYVSEQAGDVYFPDALLWVLRPRNVFGVVRGNVPPNWIVNCATHRVSALVHEGYGDVDYPWQIPAVEEWLRRHGFSESTTPYDAPRTTSLSGKSSPSAQPICHSVRTAGEHKVLITTVPFGEWDPRPLELLREAGVEYVINPIGRKLKESELADLIGDYTVLIGGTEPITAKVMDRAPHLQLISRVGVGLDSVDLMAARQRGIVVSYTAEAPAPAVAELTMGLIFALLRSIPHADRNLRNGVWYRSMGRRLAELTVGVLGVGRIGKRVIKHLQGFGPRILANDLVRHEGFAKAYGVEWMDKERIYREADVITLHLPLTRLTRGLIAKRELAMMKRDALLINTSRGSMINESDLAKALRDGRIGGAALDVFEREPYSGELATLERCVLTCHMGSMSQDCRTRMEIEATQEALRFIRSDPLQHVVPEEEYDLGWSHG